MEADNHDARLKDYSEKIIDKIHRAKTDISEEFTTSGNSRIACFVSIINSVYGHRQIIRKHRDMNQQINKRIDESMSFLLKEIDRLRDKPGKDTEPSEEEKEVLFRKLRHIKIAMQITKDSHERKSAI
ncbi:MAG: hypothetical protein NTX91_03160 [candidate division SR1 bacterium]|nr:hypothetical protein [candidate division SR1 bacterium]